MYAMWTIFTLGPEMQETADKLCEQWAPILSSLRGFKRATFVGDASTGEYAALSLWECKEDAEAALKDTEPGVKDQLGGIAKGPVTRKIFEVLRAVQA